MFTLCLWTVSTLCRPAAWFGPYVQLSHDVPCWTLPGAVKVIDPFRLILPIAMELHLFATACLLFGRIMMTHQTHSMCDSYVQTYMSLLKPPRKHMAVIEVHVMMGTHTFKVGLMNAYGWGLYQKGQLLLKGQVKQPLSILLWVHNIYVIKSLLLRWFQVQPLLSKTKHYCSKDVVTLISRASWGLRNPNLEVYRRMLLLSELEMKSNMGLRWRECRPVLHHAFRTVGCASTAERAEVVMSKASFDFFLFFELLLNQSQMHIRSTGFFVIAHKKFCFKGKVKAFFSKYFIDLVWKWDHCYSSAPI